MTNSSVGRAADCDLNRRFVVKNITHKTGFGTLKIYVPSPLRKPPTIIISFELHILPRDKHVEKTLSPSPKRECMIASVALALFVWAGNLWRDSGPASLLP